MVGEHGLKARVTSPVPVVSVAKEEGLAGAG